MPASSAENIAHIEGALKVSLQCNGPKPSLDQQLVTSSKKVLMHKIEFQPPSSKLAFHLDKLRTKYTPLNPSVLSKETSGFSKTNGQSNGKSEKGSTMSNSANSNDGIPQPVNELYPASKVRLTWPSPRPIGAGLVNLGNTCFLNSTLQCLTYMPPLTNYLLSSEHQNTCKVGGFCMICELQRHVRRAIENTGAIRPAAILQKLKMIAKHMQWGRQEDAHEFLRYVIEAMQKSALHGYNKIEKYSKETTVINRIFGGFLRSQVLCLRCKERSDTFDPFLDISLDIKNVSSVQKALEKFVHPEMLDQDNAYNCTRCKQKVPAQKCFSIHRPSNVLTLQLKRFDFHRFPVGKVTKHVSFPEKLDLRPYMSHKQGEPVEYNLYGVLVHIGGSCNSGHYYSYVRGPNQTWYCMNDAIVHVSNIGRVLNQEAYLLFYVRKTSSQTMPPSKRPIIGPQLPVVHTATGSTDKKGHGSNGKLKNDIGIPISRKSHSVATVSSQDGRPMKPEPSPSTIPMPGNREKISFGFSPKKNSVHEEVVTKMSNGKDDVKASSPSNQDGGRIVLTIKQGKVYNGSLEDIKDDSNKNGQITIKPIGLVPYQDESSEDEEKDGNENSKKTSTNGILSSQHNCNSGSTTYDHNKANLRYSKSSDIEPVLDKRLNATVLVPGAYRPLDQGPKPLFKKEKELLTKDSKCTRPVSPVKRSISDSGSPLTVSTSLEPIKVKATTPWHVLDQEADISPSVASSNGSVNSTTGWLVTNSVEKKLPLVPEAQFCGWTVTPSKETTRNASPTGATESDEPKLKELTITFKKKPISSGYANVDSAEPTHTSVGDSNSKQENCQNGSKSSEFSTISSLSSMSQDAHSETSGSNTSKTDLLNGYDINRNAHKHHKKDRKHRRHTKHILDNVSVDNSSAFDEYESSKKHKKKKKHSKRKHHRNDESDRARHHRTFADDTESDDKSTEEIVWVEKTKESFEEERLKGKTEVPVQDWDHHFKDSYTWHHDEGPSMLKVKPVWDGCRSHSVVSELEKKSYRGYGSQVNSWDGGNSIVDQEIEKEKHPEKRKHWIDDYEEELDLGKIKKTKMDRESHRDNSNLFQREQDYRNSDKKHRDRWLSDRSSNTHSHYSKYEHHGNSSNHNHHDGDHYHHHNNNYHHSFQKGNHRDHYTKHGGHHKYH